MLFNFLTFITNTFVPGIPKNIKKQEQKKQSLKILFIETYFPPFSSTAVINQITGLIDRGHDVYIYAKNKGPEEWAHPDIKKYNLMKRVFFKKLPPRLNNFDIIYCQFGYRAKELIDKLRNKKLRTKIVTCFRGSDLSKYVKRYSKQYYTKLFRVGHLFLPVCEYFKKRLIELGCNPKKITVHPSAIDCNLFAYRPRSLDPDDTIRIVTVSRLVEKKGLKYSIKAVAQLLKKYPDIHYSIVGFGELQEKLEQLIKKLGVQNNIHLVGRASQEQVAQILDNAHIFVLASVTAGNGDQEGIPNSLKEAMAMGLPVVSTFHAGTPELIEDAISGFLVPEKDINALAEKIEYLINHTDQWNQIGLAGREKVEEKYDKEKINDRLVTIFNSLMSKK